MRCNTEVHNESIQHHEQDQRGFCSLKPGGGHDVHLRDDRKTIAAERIMVFEHVTNIVDVPFQVIGIQIEMR